MLWNLLGNIPFVLFKKGQIKNAPISIRTKQWMNLKDYLVSNSIKVKKSIKKLLRRANLSSSYKK